MAKISHPSMHRTKPAPVQNQPKQQVYVVEDATAEPERLPGPSPIPQNILDMQPPAPPVQEPVEEPKQVRSMLENLLFLGRATKKVSIGEIDFEISTLTQKENASLMKELYKAGDGADLFTIRALTLAYAIKSINGTPFDRIPLDSPEDEASLQNPLDKKLAIVENMQKNVIERLHDEYVDLVDDTDNLLDKSEEQLKNS